MGSSLLALFVNAGFAGALGFWTIFVAHVLFCLSFVVVTVKARLSGLDPRLEQAAADLYANEWQTFWRVSFPLVFPGILAAALLSFSLSFDDFIITNLNAGQEVTFPMFVWGANQRGIPPQINVIGTVMFLVALLVVVLGRAGEPAARRALIGHFRCADRPTGHLRRAGSAPTGHLRRAGSRRPGTCVALDRADRALPCVWRAGSAYTRGHNGRRRTTARRGVRLSVPGCVRVSTGPPASGPLRQHKVEHPTAVGRRIFHGGAARAIRASRSRSRCARSSRQGSTQGRRILVQPGDARGAVPPLAHLGLAELRRLVLGRVPPQGLLEGEVPEVGPGGAAVVADQLQQHLGVPVRMQDAFHDHREAGVERVPRHQVHQRDRRIARAVVGPEHLPAHQVLRHHGEVASTPAPLQRTGDGGLARPAVASQDHQAGLRAADHPRMVPCRRAPGRVDSPARVVRSQQLLPRSGQSCSGATPRRRRHTS